MTRRAKPVLHARDHEHGGADPQRIHYADVGEAGEAGVALVIADEGTPLPARGTLDFVGDGVTATDDSGSDSTIVTIPGGGGGGDGDGGGFAPYASGVDPSVSLSSGSSDNLSFAYTHSSGIGISGTHITILTDGIYEMLAAGGVTLSGPSTANVDVQLLVNGSQPTPTSFTAVAFAHSFTGFYEVPMVFLDVLALDAGDVLTFLATNASDVHASFGQWHVLVRQLE